MFPPSVSTYVMTRSCRCRAAYVYWCCGALLVVTIVPCDRVIAYLYIPHLKWVLCICGTVLPVVILLLKFTTRVGLVGLCRRPVDLPEVMRECIYKTHYLVY